MKFEAHTLLFGTVAILCGYQSILFAIFTKTFAINEGLIPEDGRLNQFYRWVNLERGLALGGIALAAGIAVMTAAVVHWGAAHFGRLDYSQTMRWVIPGCALTSLGLQTVLASFFVGILGMKRR